MNCCQRTWILLILFASPWNASAENWPRFRGPNGSGASATTTIPQSWTKDRQQWMVELPGVGHSSPVVWDGLVFVTSGDPETGEQIVQCLNADDGEEIWSGRFSSATHRMHQHNSFASPTPVVDENGVYVLWGTPDAITMLALDHEGEEVWRRDLGPFRSGHGFGVSAVKHSGLLIVPIEHQEQSFWTALDEANGDVAWRVDRQSSLHYATPCIWPTSGAGDEVVFANWEQGVSGVDPTSGEVHWSADVFDKSDYESSIASPVVAGDLLIAVSGYLGRGNEVIAVDPLHPADGPRWRIATGAPLCCTPLAVGELVILWSDNGVVTCLQRETGEVLWRERIGGNFYASPVSDGEMVLNISRDGEIVVLAADREFVEVGRHNLEEGTHATAALADGFVFIRTFSKILAFADDQPAP